MKTNKKTETIIATIDKIIEGSKGCQLEISKLKPSIKSAIKYLAQRLEMTDMQALLLSAFINFSDECIEVCDLARLFDCPRVRIIRYSSDIEELCRRRLIRFRTSDNDYIVPKEVVQTLSHDMPYTPPSYQCSTIDELFDLIATLCKEHRDYSRDYNALREQMESLLEINSELPFVRRLNKLELPMAEKMFFIWCCNMLVNEDDENICDVDIRRMLGDSSRRLVRNLKDELISGRSSLIENNLLANAGNDGFAARETFVLTEYAKTQFLKGLVDINTSKQPPKGLISHSSIPAKQLFYNQSESEAIERLSQLLMPENFVTVCNRLSERGMRRGFACLFYGAPGTGKTETVLQLARQCGRDIMKVNIATIRSKWVGESEKNIKEIFERYHAAVSESDIAPILLFNEADAVISRRTSNIRSSVDKMDNAIQNIILEEMERMNGILIATTNLADNMDSAFERRFIYKIKFQQPTLEAKTAIWRSMIPSLSDTEAATLASKFDFSGGEIENIARKYAVEYILSGSDATVETLTEICMGEKLHNQSSQRKIGYI
ncbi:MAG: ATP-binding protein [Alistipes sp.]|nr:ATP-binding protein [Alistipes sp.]